MAERHLQAQHRLRVELRDARLRQPEHGAHLLHGELLVVVERDHQLLALRQARDRRGDQIDALPREQRPERILLVLLEAALQVQALLAASEAEVLEAEEAHLADAGEQLLVGLEREPELARDLLLPRRPAQRALERVRRLLDQARLLPHAARHPVERAQMVQDRAAAQRSRRRTNCTPPGDADGGRVARRAASCTSAWLAGAPGAASSTGSCSRTARRTASS